MEFDAIYENLEKPWSPETLDRAIPFPENSIMPTQPNSFVHILS